MRDDTKRILAVHDLSSFGRCALTVIIPALSAMEAQVIPLPTALLSTHTGGFSDMTFTDLSDTMSPALEHYKALGLTFDAIYTGFLGSAGQIDTVSHAIKLFGKDTLILVDPVMGDDGVVYQTYTSEMCKRMQELCHKADILTPNLTEAYLLCDEEYRESTSVSPEEALAEAQRLRKVLTERYKIKKLAITGIELANDHIATLSYDSTNAERQSVHTLHRIKNGYPGTGDLFASVLLGRVLENEDFHKAVEFAGTVVAEIISDTSKYDTARREGLRLEKNLYRLKKQL